MPGKDVAHTGAKEDAYARFAGIYDCVLNPVLEGMRRKVNEVILSEGLLRVVDLCCGTGRQCVLLHARGVETLGVDASVSMLQQARRKSPAGISYRHEDASNTSLEASSCDGVLLSLALHEKSPHVRRAILEEAGRIVKPEGAVLIVDYIRPETLASRILWPLILLVERVAGAEHARNQKLYMLEGGLEGLEVGPKEWQRQSLLPVCLGSMAIAVYRRGQRG